MRLMPVAPRAELAELLPLGVKPLVLRRMVIPLLALGAGEDDLVAHFLPPEEVAISYQSSAISRPPSVVA
jgi:hypothetical protein